MHKCLAPIICTCKMQSLHESGTAIAAALSVAPPVMIAGAPAADTATAAATSLCQCSSELPAHLNMLLLLLCYGPLLLLLQRLLLLLPP
jgi:hypothetical protein